MFSKILKPLSLIIIFIFAIILPNAANAQFNSKNVAFNLISEKSNIKAGDSFYIALSADIAPDWHTYWRNPGDVGEKTNIEWDKVNGIEFGEINWPAPSKLPFGEFINYGYSGKVIYPILVKTSKSLKGIQNIHGKVTWLECKDICIPGEAEISLDFNIGDDIKSDDAAIIRSTIDQLPQKFANISQYNIKENSILISFKQKDNLQINNAYFYPYEISSGAIINHAKPQNVEIGANGFSLKIEKSPSFPSGFNDNIGGIVEINNGNKTTYYEVDSKFSPQDIIGFDGQKPVSPFEFSKLLMAIGLAVLGGLILNLMPCVFPILAMKIIGLTKIAHVKDVGARQYGLFYGLGVVITFTILGGLIFGLKNLGAAIGWGFQLQNPVFLMFLILLMGAIGFNLLDLFEIGSNIQNIGQNIKFNSIRTSALFSGCLAVLVASPCTAPFMGFALGYALIAPPLIGLLVFIALGIGFAAPFVILTLAPKLLNALPKSGVWMDRLKKILALPMFLTSFWLIWVLSAGLGKTGIFISLFMLAIMGIGLLILGKNNALKKGLILIIILLGCISSFYINNNQNTKPSIATNENNSVAWSDSAVSEALKNHKKVFVNFTADWCITCKVNEAVVFKNPQIISAFKDKDVVYMVADWTNRNENIARALSSHGRAGVPMYLIYSSNSEEPVLLPQLLTPNIVLKTLDELN